MKRNMIMKKNKTITRLLFGAVAAVVLCTVPAGLQAGISLDITRGSEQYYQQSLTADLSPTDAWYLAAVYSRSNSDDTLAPTATYALQSSLALSPRFTLGLTGSVSPETVVTRASGLGASGTWSGHWRGNISWQATVRCARNAYAEKTEYTDDTAATPRIVTNWLDLTQTLIEPSGAVTFKGKYTLSFGIIGYSYDRELAAFSQNLSQLEELLPAGTGMSALVSGFPGSIVHAGITAGVLPRMNITYVGARTVYAASQQPDEFSSFIGLSWAALPVLEVRGSYNAISTGSYYSCGFHWLWQ
jgi:hypothetical protein